MKKNEELIVAPPHQIVDAMSKFDDAKLVFNDDEMSVFDGLEEIPNNNNNILVGNVYLLLVIEPIEVSLYNEE
jgi:hypothetical protein